MTDWHASPCSPRPCRACGPTAVSQGRGAQLFRRASAHLALSLTAAVMAIAVTAEPMRRYNSSHLEFTWRITVPVDTAAVVMIPLAGEAECLNVGAHRMIMTHAFRKRVDFASHQPQLLKGRNFDAVSCFLFRVILADGDKERDVTEGSPPRPLSEVQDVQVFERHMYFGVLPPSPSSLAAAAAADVLRQ